MSGSTASPWAVASGAKATLSASLLAPQRLTLLPFVHHSLRTSPSYITQHCARRFCACKCVAVSVCVCVCV